MKKLMDVPVPAWKGKMKRIDAHITLNGQRQHYQSLADEAAMLAKETEGPEREQLLKQAEHYASVAADNSMLTSLARAARARILGR